MVCRFLNCICQSTTRLSNFLNWTSLYKDDGLPQNFQPSVADHKDVPSSGDCGHSTTGKSNISFYLSAVLIHLIFFSLKNQILKLIAMRNICFKGRFLTIVNQVRFCSLLLNIVNS